MQVQEVRLVAVVGLLVGMLVVAVPVEATNAIYAEGVSDPYPQQYSNETITVEIGYADKTPFPGMAIHSVWNYRTTTSRTRRRIIEDSPI
jgi:hypothetical protein